MMLGITLTYCTDWIMFAAHTSLQSHITLQASLHRLLALLEQVPDVLHRQLSAAWLCLRCGVQLEVALCGGSMQHQMLVKVAAEDREEVPPIAPVCHVVEDERLHDCLGPDAEDTAVPQKL